MRIEFIRIWPKNGFKDWSWFIFDKIGTESKEGNRNCKEQVFQVKFKREIIAKVRHL